MSQRIIRAFEELRARSGKGLIPFVCGGHPSLAAMGDTLRALEAGGATVIEIGIPFSDPIADGPVIAAAMHEALRAGVTPEAIFREVRLARAAGLRTPLAAMVSISIVHRLGAERFARDAAAAGFDGLIVPDAPLEEADALGTIAARAGLALTLLVAPTTPPERAAEIARRCTGFVYLLARVGITGAGGGPGGGDPSSPAAPAGPSIRARVEALRPHTPAPIACGFGIASAADVRAVVRDGGADAAIVGSALVSRMTDANRTGRNPAEEASCVMRELSGGLI